MDRPSYRSCRQRRRDLDRYGPEQPGSLLSQLCLGGFGASFGPIIILSLLWKGVTRNGALVGIIVGALTVLIWHQGAWWGMYEIIPGFVLSFIAIIVVSLLDPNKPSATMIETFDKVQHKLEDVKKQLA